MSLYPSPQKIRDIVVDTRRVEDTIESVLSEAQDPAIRVKNEVSSARKATHQGTKVNPKTRISPPRWERQDPPAGHKILTPRRVT